MTELIAPDLSAIRRVVVAHDGDEHVLGRPDLGVYVTVPAAGAVFVAALQAQASVPEATARASAEAGTDVDGEDFLAGLRAAGLLDPPGDAAPGPATGGLSRTRDIRWIEGVSPAAARRLFGRAAWTCYAAAAVSVAVMLVARPDLRPSYEHALWLPDPILSVITVTLIAWATTALHEVGHWLAGRAIGVPAAFRISFRGIFLVFETDVSQLVTLPRRRRYGVFLAGTAVDLAVAALALALRLAHQDGLIPLPSWLDRLLAAIVLLQLFRTFLQGALLFLRTDGYAVLANALRCHDLYRATWLTTKRRLWRLTEPEAAELAAISPHDRRVARWFQLGYLASVAAMAWVAFTFVLPFLVRIGDWVAEHLRHPVPTSPAFWESVAILLIVIGQYAVLPLLALREWRLRRRGRFR
jgi:putative peptide zinc metalloprotease protein